MTDFNSGFLIVTAELAAKANDFSAMLESSNRISQLLPPLVDPIDAMPMQHDAARMLLCLAGKLEKNPPYAFAAFGAASTAIPYLTNDPDAVAFGASIVLGHIARLPAKAYSETLDITHATVMEANSVHFQKHGKYSDTLTALKEQLTGMIDRLGMNSPTPIKPASPLRIYRLATFD